MRPHNEKTKQNRVTVTVMVILPVVQRVIIIIIIIINEFD